MVNIDKDLAVSSSLQRAFNNLRYFSASTVYGYEAYSPHPEYKTSETFTWYNIPIWGWILIALPIMGVIAICMALAAWKIIAQLSRYESSFEDMEASSEGQQRSTARRTNNKILCPLCVKKISCRSWKSGRHRQKCARKYDLKIQNEWPIFNPTVSCPICNKNLRKLPTLRTAFKCTLCPSQTIIIGCFLCDFHLCQACVQNQQNPRPNFVPPKTNPIYQEEPSAPSYDLVVKDNDDEYLPTYEEAIINLQKE